MNPFLSFIAEAFGVRKQVRSYLLIFLYSVLISSSCKPKGSQDSKLQIPQTAEEVNAGNAIDLDELAVIYDTATYHMCEYSYQTYCPGLEKYVLKLSGEGYNGAAMRVHKNTLRLLEKGILVDGRRADWMLFDDTGNIIGRGNLYNGEWRTFEWATHPDRVAPELQNASRMTFVDGEMHGPHVTYRDGYVVDTGTYSHNRRIGFGFRSFSVEDYGDGSSYGFASEVTLSSGEMRFDVGGVLLWSHHGLTRQYMVWSPASDKRYLAPTLGYRELVVTGIEIDSSLVRVNGQRSSSIFLSCLQLFERGIDGPIEEHDASQLMTTETRRRLASLCFSPFPFDSLPAIVPKRSWDKIYQEKFH